MTIKTAIEKYLSWKSSYTNKAPITYRRWLDIFALLNKKEARNITLEDVIKYQQTIKIKYAPATLCLAMTIIRDFLKFTQGQGITTIDYNLVRIPRFTPKLRIVPTNEEIEAMLNVLSDDNYHDLRIKSCLLLLKDTGMRISELVRLNISDLENVPYCTIQTSKGNRHNVVAWSKSTHNTLIRYLGIRISMNQYEPLFERYGRRITTRAVEKWFEKIRVRAGITKRITPHSFRHWKAHDMIGRGANVKEIQVVLRHSEKNPMASFQYLRLDTRESLKIAEKYV